MEVPIREEFTRCQNIQPMQLHIKYISHLLALWLSLKSILKKYCSPNVSENFEKCIQFYDMFVNRMHELQVNFFL